MNEKTAINKFFEDVERWGQAMGNTDWAERTLAAHAERPGHSFNSNAYVHIPTGHVWLPWPEHSQSYQCRDTGEKCLDFWKTKISGNGDDWRRPEAADDGAWIFNPSKSEDEIRYAERALQTALKTQEAAAALLEHRDEITEDILSGKGRDIHFYFLHFCQCSRDDVGDWGSIAAHLSMANDAVKGIEGKIYLY